jgi:PiT family inorganic phosphate transporter
MLLMLIAVVVVTLILAFANGANDVSKGIATLVGSGVSDYRKAVLWGTAWSVAGGLTAALVTQGLVATFSGQGLLRSAASGEAFLLAVACGAIGWLLIATRTGLPVSTTHSLMGALIGAGIAAQTVGGVVWPALIRKAALPLALSPLLSLVLVVVIYPLLRRSLGRADRLCLCVEREEVIVSSSGAAVAFDSRPIVNVAPATACSKSSPIARVGVLDSVHWLSSGATSFFRGVNDTPKILAVGVVAAAALGLAAGPFYALVAVAMGLGSLVWGFRVTNTLACKVTAITPTNGFAANFITSILVAGASLYALPVSTTQVSTGAIIGTGLAGGGTELRWKMIGEMLLAWIVTLPVAGLLAAGVYKLLA